MKGPKWVRVDDRLIHGEVGVCWMGALETNKIVVVDDGTAKDDFLKEVLILAAPAGSVLSVFSTAEAIAGDWSRFDGALVLVKNPLTALALRKAGLEFPVLNMGGVGARPGRKQLWKNISATPEEIQALEEYERLGGQVVFQIVPSDGAVAFSKVKRS